MQNNYNFPTVVPLLRRAVVVSCCSRRFLTFIVLVVCVADVFVNLKGFSVCSEAVAYGTLAETVF